LQATRETLAPQDSGASGGRVNALKLYKELARRNVIRIAIANAVATRVLLQIVTVVIVAALVLAVVLLLFERQSNRVPEPVSQTAAATDDESRSIAMLPFINMSSDAEQEFFSDGITEEILNSLASVKKFKVAGRTSSFAFKGQNDDLRRIGEALGVNHILEGSVRKSGEQVRITAQLIQVDNGFHVWSEIYERQLTNVFAIQDKIANEILKQLKNQLLGDEAVVADARRTAPEVYELNLRARQRLYMRVGLEAEIVGLPPMSEDYGAMQGSTTERP
jgi:TolB-like protein